MKAGIHPNYVQATVTCACGNTFTTRSTRDEIRTDLCNVCHPFYTGEQRIVDTAGQVERFMRRFEAAQAQERRGSKRQQRLQARAAQIEEQERKQQEAEARERAAGDQADLAPANAETTDADAGETPAEA